MRCFVAVDLDTRLTEKIVGLQKELVGLDTKLVEPHNLHFTLKFLGEIDGKVTGVVKAALAKVAAGREPFSITIEHVGCFPSEKFIRVVWVGAEKLTELQEAVNESLALFKKEKPSPHLTIARVRSQKCREDLVNFIHRHKNEETGSMLVKEIKLKKSTVTSKGPVYEDIAVFELKP